MQRHLQLAGSRPVKGDPCGRGLLSPFPIKPAGVPPDVLLPENPAGSVPRLRGSVLSGRGAIAQTLGISSRYSQLRQDKLRLHVPTLDTHLQPKGFSP